MKIINKKNTADTLYEKNAETKPVKSEIEIILDIIGFISKILFIKFWIIYVLAFNQDEYITFYVRI